MRTIADTADLVTGRPDKLTLLLPPAGQAFLQMAGQENAEQPSSTADVSGPPDAPAAATACATAPATTLIAVPALSSDSARILHSYVLSQWNVSKGLLLLPQKPALAVLHSQAAQLDCLEEC